MSCSSGGKCAAGGQYFATAGEGRAFVLTGKNGQWGRAIEVPGLAAAKPKPTDAGIDSVSCAPSGGCVAGGTYVDASKRFHVFVTSEKNGQWSRLTTIFTGTKSASGVSLSCPVQGSCTAGDALPPFAVNEAHGKWGRVTVFQPKARLASVEVSCASAGNCTAGWGKFVVSERKGHWGKAAAVPGLARLGTSAFIRSITCTAATNCAAGGDYLHNSDATEVFVASERNGHWAKAIELPGFTALNTQGSGLLPAVSCLSAGNCVTGGSYAAPADFQGGSFQAFVDSERNGHWSKAIEVPGIPVPSTSICEPDSNKCVAGQTLTLSCSHSGACVAGGWYDTPKINGQAGFVTSYKNGHWSHVIQIPGLAALGIADSSQVNSVSCAPTGTCAAGGNAGTTGPAFLTFEKNGTWGQAKLVRF